MFSNYRRDASHLNIFMGCPFRKVYGGQTLFFTLKGTNYDSFRNFMVLHEEIDTHTQTHTLTGGLDLDTLQKITVLTCSKNIQTKHIIKLRHFL